ncbi:MAG TPA: hypothetical protein VFG45_05955 [Candidatus Nitrosocosmicus sp.]|nr:hypothetical protein [Candidatus Nitrosocosmicus sp.]
MSTSVDPEKLNYIGLINESVHTSDDKDVGDVFAINKHFLVVKRGYINIHYYYIPLKKVEGWDGTVLWLLSTEEEVKKYERNVFPHPFRYYVKDYSYERTPPFVPTFDQIPSKFRTTAEEYAADNKGEIEVYQCDLCGDVCKNEDEYEKHITSSHL